jgi:hypothetical protein
MHDVNLLTFFFFLHSSNRVSLFYAEGVTSADFIQSVRKVAVHLQKVLAVMSTSVYRGLNPFNFIFKHFLYTR